MISGRFILILIILVLNVLSVQLGALEVSHIFGSNMVLQRADKIPVYGTAEPEAEVTVEFAGKKIKAGADKSGKWITFFSGIKPGGPYSLMISQKDRKPVILKNIMVGDVWLCSGQSHMQLSVKNADNAEVEIAAANHPRIRFFNVLNQPQAGGDETRVVLRGRWKVCSPRSISYFSAAAYYFARDLQRSIDVPVGIIETSWGGALCSAWCSRNCLYERKYSNLISVYEKAMANNGNSGLQEYKAQEKKWLEATDLIWNDHSGYEFVKPDFNDSSWSEVDLPISIEKAINEKTFDGTVWFRKHVTLTAKDAGKDAELSLGGIDDYDETFVNGVKVGSTARETPLFWEIKRKYKIPGKLLKVGDNVIAVRVFDNFYSGGFISDKSFLTLKLASGTIGIAENWKSKKEFTLTANKPEDLAISSDSPQAPTSLFNTRIHPVAPFDLKGVVWYEDITPLYTQEGLYLFDDVIECWRKLWGRELPFIYVQLSGADVGNDQKQAEMIPLFREKQLHSLKLGETAMVVSTDLSTRSDLRIRNMQEVGRRLSLAAQKLVYGLESSVSGPLYRSHEIKDGRIVLSFDSVAGGLKAGGKNKELIGFQIAGKDHVFYPASAIINGDKVIVGSDKVAEPAAVRYGWSVNPVKANLRDASGLPASPFRTDNWE